MVQAKKNIDRTWECALCSKALSQTHLDSKIHLGKVYAFKIHVPDKAKYQVAPDDFWSQELIVPEHWYPAKNFEWSPLGGAFKCKLCFCTASDAHVDSTKHKTRVKQQQDQEEFMRSCPWVAKYDNDGGNYNSNPQCSQYVWPQQSPAVQHWSSGTWRQPSQQLQQTLPATARQQPQLQQQNHELQEFDKIQFLRFQQFEKRQLMELPEQTQLQHHFCERQEFERQQFVGLQQFEMQQFVEGQESKLQLSQPTQRLRERQDLEKRQFVQRQQFELRQFVEAQELKVQQLQTREWRKYTYTPTMDEPPQQHLGPIWRPPGWKYKCEEF